MVGTWVREMETGSQFLQEGLENRDEASLCWNMMNPGLEHSQGLSGTGGQNGRRLHHVVGRRYLSSETKGNTIRSYKLGYCSRICAAHTDAGRANGDARPRMCEQMALTGLWILQAHLLCGLSSGCSLTQSHCMCHL